MVQPATWPAPQAAGGSYRISDDDEHLVRIFLQGRRDVDVDRRELTGELAGPREWPHGGGGWDKQMAALNDLLQPLRRPGQRGRTLEEILGDALGRGNAGNDGLWVSLPTATSFEHISTHGAALHLSPLRLFRPEANAAKDPRGTRIDANLAPATGPRAVARVLQECAVHGFTPEVRLWIHGRRHINTARDRCVIRVQESERYVVQRALFGMPRLLEAETPLLSERVFDGVATAQNPVSKRDFHEHYTAVLKHLFTSTYRSFSRTAGLTAGPLAAFRRDPDRDPALLATLVESFRRDVATATGGKSITVSNPLSGAVAFEAALGRRAPGPPAVLVRPRNGPPSRRPGPRP